MNYLALSEILVKTPALEDLKEQLIEKIIAIPLEMCQKLTKISGIAFNNVLTLMPNTLSISVLKHD